MEMMFNELSVMSAADKYTAQNKLALFAKTANRARKEGFRHIRSHYDTNQIRLAEDYTLFDWLNDKSVPKDYRDYMYGMIVLPFIKEDDMEIEEHYVAANYYFEDKDANISKTECLGLAAAYLYETLSISLSTSPMWEQYKLPVIIEEKAQVSLASVYNITSPASFVPEIIDFIDEIKELTLIETAIAPNEKSIHLSHHHGIRELQNLCDQLKNCSYVEEMCSTNWGGSTFIRKAHKDGIIEIVLFNTEKRYALSVKTTGRNLRETEAIAKILFSVED
ncbi:MAG: hypothetical protein LBC19_02585 [Tannerella sp.]|jgi:hypothetical protein|nr:hypothetical protein [Tannerella sp.]